MILEIEQAVGKRTGWETIGNANLKQIPSEVHSNHAMLKGKSQ
jgi:hypothetical protein